MVEWNAISFVSKFRPQLERIADKSLIKVYGHLLGMIIRSKREFGFMQMKSNQSYDRKLCDMKFFELLIFFLRTSKENQKYLLRKVEISLKKKTIWTNKYDVDSKQVTLRGDDFIVGK